MTDDTPETTPISAEEVDAFTRHAVRQAGKQHQRETWLRKQALEAALLAERELPSALCQPADDLDLPDDHLATFKPTAAIADKMNERTRLTERATIGRILRHAQVFENYMNTGFTNQDWDRAGIYAEFRTIDMQMERLEREDSADGGQAGEAGEQA